MKRYQSHKIVEAAPIHGWSPGMTFVTVKTENDIEKIEVPVNFFGRGLPRQGDYLVRYLPDGYLSWSPKQAFEDGYKLLG